MTRTGMMLGLMAGLAGCPPHQPPPPPPPAQPDMARPLTQAPCEVTPAQNNAGIAQGPELRGSVIGSYCFLASVPSVTSTTTALSGDMAGVPGRVDMDVGPITFNLHVGPPLRAGWRAPVATNVECGDCTTLDAAAAPLYNVTYDDGGTRRPLCPGGRDALLVRNVSLDRRAPPSSATASYTFACPGSALWHCALDWGFNPATEADLFKTCLRAEIADYCGNGSANTVTGVPVFLSRRGGRPAGAEWQTVPEAIWGPDGSHCVISPRVPYRATSSNLVTDYIANTSQCTGRIQPTCALPDAATADSQHLLVSWIMAVGESPLCDHGQACVAAASPAAPAAPASKRAPSAH